MDADSFFLCIILGPVALIFLIPVFYYVGKWRASKQTDRVTMDVVDVVQTKDGDVRITPRAGTIILGFGVGAVLIGFGVIIVINIFGKPLDLTSACLFPAAALGLAGLGVSVMIYAGRALRVPSVVISAADKTVTIRRPGGFMNENIPISHITKIDRAPAGRSVSFLANLGIGLLQVVSTFGGQPIASRDGFGDSIDLVRLDLQLADGRTVLLAIIPEIKVNEFRRFLSNLLPMI